MTWHGLKLEVIWHPGPCINIRASFPGMGIPTLKIRWLPDHLIFNMGIHILVRRHLYIETAPGSLELKTLKCPSLLIFGIKSLVRWVMQLLLFQASTPFAGARVGSLHLRNIHKYIHVLTYMHGCVYNRSDPGHTVNYEIKSFSCWYICRQQRSLDWNW